MKTLNSELKTASNFSIADITRHPSLMEYRRLAFLVAIANIAVFVLGLRSGLWVNDNIFQLMQIADIALINLTLAILIRQQRVVNFLFWFATRIPTSWPLWIRWGAGKIFHFGGIHSAGAVSGSLWLVFLFVGMLINYRNGTDNSSILTLSLTFSMLACMGGMIVFAIGPIRAKYHDLFERSHRFLGWTLLILFWLQTISINYDNDISFVKTAAFLCLLLISLSIISPWLTLKKVPVKSTRLSNHAVMLDFNYGDTPFPGSSNALSLSPLTEWHSFANIPIPGREGYQQIVSRSGDWTGKLIDNPPEHIWVKGITTSGVARIEVLFKKILYVGTGSGIGPILPHLFAKNVPSQLIWSTRSPQDNYGQKLYEDIIKSSPNAVIWDTDLKGKPDLTELSLKTLETFDAEAVIVISNQKLTRKLVYDLERRGIPAYGAIWDS